MIKKVKSFIPLLLKKDVREAFSSYAVKSYSQEGEDMILRRIFEGVDHGYYVDVGAHHPKRFSNTYYFYKRGWSGINIDAMPGSMSLFDIWRPRDINIECAVGNGVKELTLFIFNEPALSTFDEQLAHQRSNGTYKVIREHKMKPMPLRELLAKHLPGNGKIDFMSIDVEGHDLDVARSNDWKLFRPKFVLLESFGKNIDEIRSGELFRFMNDQNYDLFAKTVLTLFFEDRLAKTS